MNLLGGLEFFVIDHVYYSLLLYHIYSLLL